MNETSKRPNKRQAELLVLIYGNVLGPQRKSLALAFLHHPLSFPATPNPHCKHNSWLPSRPTKAIPQPRLPPKKGEHLLDLA